MFDRTILSLGLSVALVTGLVATPAKSAPVGAVVAAGTVGVILGAGIASLGRRDEPRYVLGGEWDYGAPGWQRPRPVGWRGFDVLPGPGRHRVCAWQERYDSRERYMGSRRICWVEAR